MSPGPRAVEVRLSDVEFAELSRWADGAVEPRLAERARIILACAGGMPNTCVAADLKVTAATVRKWRSRFAVHRLEGLMDVPRPGRRKVDLVLSEAERSQLMRWARRARTAQFLALRARIVLRCAEGGTNKQVAAELGVGEQSVNRWRARFVKRRLDGLVDEPRPGRPPSVLLDQVEDVVIATLESTPGRDTHWSRASMASRTGLSKSTIGRIWKKFDLRHFCVSPYGTARRQCSEVRFAM
ncbi:helix-turn-helix domain-containing protein [Streptomyces sp. NPDC005373]|uniref:helix-turn-helix domain-containing protein n=1 Tax=Streptomyces sp. NPDC005373 TaxID=3156879 RepID=UPI0033AA6C6B